MKILWIIYLTNVPNSQTRRFARFYANRKNICFGVHFEPPEHQPVKNQPRDFRIPRKSSGQASPNATVKNLTILIYEVPEQFGEWKWKSRKPASNSHGSVFRHVDRINPFLLIYSSVAACLIMQFDSARFWCFRVGHTSGLQWQLRGPESLSRFCIFLQRARSASETARISSQEHR